jgi:hypothetical protein
MLHLLACKRRVNEKLRDSRLQLFENAFPELSQSLALLSIAIDQVVRSERAILLELYSLVSAAERG